MLQATKILHQGHGLAPSLLKRAATVELGWDVRQKSRFECTDSHGRQLGVFLQRGTVVRGGDVLVAEDGTMVRVVAAPQAVLLVQHVGERGSVFDLLRAAYHLGNRHVAVELKPDHLKIEPDHVLAEMLRGMHLAVLDTFAAFEPEGGAYGGHAAHAHEGHHHGQRHTESQPYEHEHDSQLHDHEHDGHKHGEHGQSCVHG
jgi:urease accessory protein